MTANPVANGGLLREPLDMPDFRKFAEFYQAHVAGKPRLDGARATLEGLGVAEAAARAPEYARKKQALIDLLIAEGRFEAFPDAVRFADGLHASGLRLALASSSKNVAAHAAPPEPAR
jgi:beta-phosphoglucomutase